MFVVVQHPLSNMWQFFGDPAESGRLWRPNWPLAQPLADFVRSFGVVRMRDKGGLEDWPGEDVYGDASRALLFEDHLRFKKLGSDSLTGHASHAFRRFYSEGTVARVEVGLRIDVAPDAAQSADREAWLQLLVNCLKLPARVRDGQGKLQAVQLITAGEDLAFHYFRASIDRRPEHPPLRPPQPWWVLAGAPAIFVECHELQPIPPLPHSLVVFDNDAVGTLFHAWLKVGPHLCSSWWLTSNGKRKDDKRRLRLHLLRLHAERECLRLVLESVANGRLSITKELDVSNAVQDYLNEAIRALEKTERYGVPQSEMLDAARNAIGIAFVGKDASFQSMRRQILTKVERYIRVTETKAMVVNNFYGGQMNTTIQMGNVSVNGNFSVVTAQQIENSFNEATKAAIDDKLKDALIALTIQVANLVKELPMDDAETASRDLETLTKEATSKRPRQQWYEISAQGLLDAAKAVATLAAPVASAVKAVLALLP